MGEEVLARALRIAAKDYLEGVLIYPTEEEVNRQADKWLERAKGKKATTESFEAIIHFDGPSNEEIECDYWIGEDDLPEM
uniref:Uncharacterized protein n=1 Tax=viral metagenome TaxID=1070528 RepID=A0A6M3L183_9ZZZZ